MRKWFPPLALTALLLVVAWFIAMMAIDTFTDWLDPAAPAPTQVQRYLDEAWQQFSH